MLNWLLEKNEPAVRYLSLTELMEKEKDDPGVIETDEQLRKRGWAADILGSQLPDGSWVSGESLDRPKYLSTNWMLLILSDFGLTRAECELWIKRFAKTDGGFAKEGMTKSHLCIAGKTARALVMFGYIDHPM